MNLTPGDFLALLVLAALLVIMWSGWIGRERAPARLSDGERKEPRR